MSDREWLRNFATYAEYRRRIIEAKQALPDKTIRLLSEEEFDGIRWGDMPEQRNDEEHRELERRMNATESRLDGALGHLYGAEGRGGALIQMEHTQEKILLALEHLDGKFDALILKQEQDKAQQDLRIAQVKQDVDNIGAKIRTQGAGMKKFRDAAIGAAAVGIMGVLVAWLQRMGTSIRDIMGP